MLYKIHKEKVALKQEDYVKMSTGFNTRKNHQYSIEIPYARKDVYKNSFFQEQVERGIHSTNSLC